MLGFAGWFAASPMWLTRVRFLQIGSLPPEPLLPCPGAEKVGCAPLPEAVRRRFWEAMGRNRNPHSRVEKQRFQIPHGWSVFVWATAGVVKSVNIRNYFGILFSLCQEEPKKVPF